MKNYRLGIIALIVAISAAAFTPVKKSSIPFGTKLFRYSAPAGSFSEANVENRANWIFVESTEGCNGNNVKACEILVNDVHVNPDNTLKSSLTIVATQASGGTFYVSGGTMSDKVNTSE